MTYELYHHGVKRVYWGANINNNKSIDMAKSVGFEYLKRAQYDDMSVVYVKDL